MQICHTDGAVKVDEINVIEDGLEVSGVLEVRYFILAQMMNPFKYNKKHDTIFTNN